MGYEKNNMIHFETYSSVLFASLASLIIVLLIKVIRSLLDK